MKRTSLTLKTVALLLGLCVALACDASAFSFGDFSKARKSQRRQQRTYQTNWAQAAANAVSHQGVVQQLSTNSQDDGDDGFVPRINRRVVEYYEDGSIKRVTTLFRNGKKRREINYRNDGTKEKELVYRPNGKLRLETHYDSLERVGERKVYRKNGTLKTRVRYVYFGPGNDTRYGLDGTWKEVNKYNRRGQLIVSSSYRGNGEIYRKIRYSSRTGLAVSKKTYHWAKDGVKVLASVVTYDTNGNVQRLVEYDKDGNLLNDFTNDGDTYIFESSYTNDHNRPSTWGAAELPHSIYVVVQNDLVIVTKDAPPHGLIPSNADREEFNFVTGDLLLNQLLYTVSDDLYYIAQTLQTQVKWRLNYALNLATDPSDQARLQVAIDRIDDWIQTNIVSTVELKDATGRVYKVLHYDGSGEFTHADYPLTLEVGIPYTTITVDQGVVDLVFQSASSYSARSADLVNNTAGFVTYFIPQDWTVDGDVDPELYVEELTKILNAARSIRDDLPGIMADPISSWPATPQDIADIETIILMLEVELMEFGVAQP